MPARTAVALPAALAALLVLAGCAGVTPPTDATTSSESGANATTSPAPSFSGSDAADRALAAEREYVFATKVPADATASGTGGVARTRAESVAHTANARVVRVQFAFWYTKNTSEGQLHADGVTRTAYYVTADSLDRVSLRGRELGGESATSGAGTVVVRVANFANDSRTVSLSVRRAGGDAVYERAPAVGGDSTVESPRLTVPAGDYVVAAATGDGPTRTAAVSVPADAGARYVTVFVTPDGAVRVAATPDWP